jgi:hypothetical protein
MELQAKQSNDLLAITWHHVCYVNYDGVLFTFRTSKNIFRLRRGMELDIMVFLASKIFPKKDTCTCTFPVVCQ